jgi:hypothetical protein
MLAHYDALKKRQGSWAQWSDEKLLGPNEVARIKLPAFHNVFSCFET